MSNEEKKKQFPATKLNYMIIGGGFVLVIIGFMLMAGGNSEGPNDFNPEIFSFRRVTLAPIVVLLGFGVVLYGIMRKPKSEEE